MTKKEDSHANAVREYMSSRDLEIELPSAEEIKTRLEEAKREREQYIKDETARRQPRDEPTGIVCRVCTGQIVERLRKPPMREFHSCDRIGGRQSWTIESKLPPKPISVGFHCARCGIEYHDPKLLLNKDT